MHEVHVVGDHSFDGLDGVIGVFEAFENFFGQFGADLVMAVEADAVFVRVVGVGGGFADVVEEDGEGQLDGRILADHFEHDGGVCVDVALGVELRWLFAADEIADFGDDVVDEVGFDEEAESSGAVGVEKDFV